MVIFVANSLILDAFFLLPTNKPLLQNNSSAKDEKSLDVSENFCPQSCVDKINKIASSSTTQAATTGTPIVLTPTAIPISTPTPLPPTPTRTDTVKEFFVPLGAGSGNSSDWSVISGAGAKIDPSDYGDIKTMTFEATLRIPTGNEIVWIRLYNANTYQMISGSEMTLSSGTPTLLISQPISLVSGNNLYQIQMKTQLQYPANIDMARLRIKTN